MWNTCRSAAVAVVAIVVREPLVVVVAVRSLLVLIQLPFQPIQSQSVLVTRVQPLAPILALAGCPLSRERLHHLLLVVVV